MQLTMSDCSQHDTVESTVNYVIYSFHNALWGQFAALELMPLSTHVAHLSMCKSVCICFTDAGAEGAMSSDRYFSSLSSWDVHSWSIWCRPRWRAGNSDRRLLKVSCSNCWPGWYLASLQPVLLAAPDVKLKGQLFDTVYGASRLEVGNNKQATARGSSILFLFE